MKVFTQKKYGGPEVLNPDEMEKPVPKENEVLVKVKALSINPAEWHLLQGRIWLVRLGFGLTKPRNPVPGADVAGIVEAVGNGVTSFKRGDQVFGRVWNGGLAEYICVQEDKIALMPDGTSFEEAAAIPLAANTAQVALYRTLKVQEGQSLLINGASGGIGSFAVQLAKYYGAEVTAVCSSRNKELVQSLGADHVIDYTHEDFTLHTHQFDLFADLVGNRPLQQIRHLLKPKGRGVFVGFTDARKMMGFMLGGSLLSAVGSRKFFSIDVKTNGKDLEYLGQLVKDGFLKPVIDRVFPFEETPRAFAHLGTRHARGKIVIRL